MTVQHTANISDVKSTVSANKERKMVFLCLEKNKKDGSIQLSEVSDKEKL